jgi:hypothetical protein
MSAPEDDAQGIYQAAAQTILTQHFSDLPRSVVVVLFVCTMYGLEKDALQHILTQCISAVLLVVVSYCIYCLVDRNRISMHQKRGCTRDLTSSCTKNAQPAVAQLFIVVDSPFIVFVGRNAFMHALCMHAPEVDVAVIYQALQIILTYCCCSCCFTLFGCCCLQNRISMHVPENDAPGIYQAVAQNIPTHQAVLLLLYRLLFGCWHYRN